ncbi:MAG: Nitroreductase [Parcubacteria group bacterium GW2011_GWA2_51_10]|nr:MAG: Nitroreductase [Parcubacteria group bacterium GW2011_GWA2_51_10]
MKENIERYIRAGIRAPSGENAQPWRFFAGDSAIDVWLAPEVDQSIYNWGQRASYMACGAALENIVLAASADGYGASVAYFPDQDHNHVATITLREGGRKDPLAGAIDARTTNRKPYERRVLSVEERAALLGAAKSESSTVLTLVESRESVDALGRAGAVNEEIMLTNKKIHDFFFSHINWTRGEDDRSSAGFYIETLELPPPGRAIFKLLRSWSIARILCLVGMHKAIAKQNGATNASASAIGCLISSGTQPIDFVIAGRVLERVWLAATLRSLSVQPLAGILFLRLKLENDGAHGFGHAHVRILKDTYATVERICSAGGRPVTFMFRVGHAEPPTARSSRLPLSAVLK